MNLTATIGSGALPAHLQDFGAAANISQSATGGIQIGQSHSRISIKQNRFRLLSEQGQEYVVPQLHLDVIVVGANDHVSKLYYAAAFNPADPEPPAPDCYSDNGIGPSDRALRPQSATCAGCPHAAWGSKLTPAGVKVKACSDSKKLAVLLADNPTGAIYELRVPAATMENLVGVMNQIGKATPLPSVVLRVTFDATSNYPKLLFTPVAYITPEQKAAVLDAIGSDEADKVVGKDDKARDPSVPLLAAGAGQVAVPQQPALPAFAPPVQAHPNPPQVFTPPPIPMAMPVIPQQQPAPPVPQPASAPAFNPMAAPAPAAAAPQTFNPFGGAVPGFQGAVPPATAPAAEAPAKRKRRTKAEMAAAGPVETPPQMVVPPLVPAGYQVQSTAPQMVAPLPDVPHALAPAASVPMSAPPTDANLDALICNAMRRQ